MGSVRMTKYAKDSATAMADWCLANGLDFGFVGFTGKGHPQYELAWQMQRRKITTASTTSDKGRALKNCVSQCRKLALEMGWTEQDGIKANRILKAAGAAAEIANQAIKKTETEQTMDKPKTDLETETTGSPCPVPLPGQITETSNRPRYTGRFAARLVIRNEWIDRQLREGRDADEVFAEVTAAGWKFDSATAMRQALNFAKRKERQAAEERGDIPLDQALAQAIAPVVQAVIEKEVAKATGDLQAKLDLLKEVMGQ